MVFSGDELQKMLEGTMKVQVACRKCGHRFTFEEGGGAAIDQGIRAKVVMCPKCRSIYETNVTPRGVTLLADVTERYPQAGGTAEGGKQKWRFWK
jgi:NAD-dependent SIR2 family protein deacetylase